MKPFFISLFALSPLVGSAAQINWTSGASTLNETSRSQSTTTTARNYHSVRHPEGGVGANVGLALGFQTKAASCSAGGATTDRSQNASSSGGGTTTVSVVFDADEAMIVTFDFPHSARSSGSASAPPVADRGDPTFSVRSSAQVTVSTSVSPSNQGQLLSESSGLQALDQWFQNSSGQVLDPGFSQVRYQLEPGAEVTIQTSISVSASAGGSNGGKGACSASATLGSLIRSVTDLSGNPLVPTITEDDLNSEWRVGPLPAPSFEDWVIGFLSEESAADEEVDSDGDGWTNGEEYLVQTDPSDLNDRFATPLVQSENGFSLRFPKESPLARYCILKSETGLRENDFSEIVVREPASFVEEPVLVELPMSISERAFYRVKVEKR